MPRFDDTGPLRVQTMLTYRKQGVGDNRTQPISETIDVMAKKHKTGNNKKILHKNTRFPSRLRKKKVSAIRKKLATGKYDIDGKLNVAFDRLIEELLG